MPSAAPMNCSTSNGFAMCTSVLSLNPPTWFSAGNVADGCELSERRSAIVASYWVRVSSDNGEGGCSSGVQSACPMSVDAAELTLGAPLEQPRGASSSAHIGPSEQKAKRMIEFE